MRLSVQSAAFDPGHEANEFVRKLDGAGAIVTFTGLVRGESGALSGMEIEHYPGMTERAITAMLTDACARWSLLDAMVIHRVGPLEVGAPIMMVATAAAHRADAFSAAEFLMDYLKSRAPFWKKERHAGGADWVQAKDADEDALKRW